MTTSGTSSRDRDRAGDRLLDLAPELGRVDDRLVAAQALQQRGVAGGVERVRRAHPLAPPEPHELRLREMEPVHRHQPRPLAELGDDLARDRRLAAPGRPGDPEDAAARPACASARARATSASASSMTIAHRRGTHDLRGPSQHPASSRRRRSARRPCGDRQGRGRAGGRRARTTARRRGRRPARADTRSVAVTRPVPSSSASPARRPGGEHLDVLERDRVAPRLLSRRSVVTRTSTRAPGDDGLRRAGRDHVDGPLAALDRRLGRRRRRAASRSRGDRRRPWRTGTASFCPASAAANAGSPGGA